MARAAAPRPLGIRMFEGLLPIGRADIGVEVVAGVTLAALAIPEVMGYTQIAGMPVVTGLYTILLPVLVFGALGSSRHLVVGADSATAAVMAAGLAGLADSGSTKYIALAGLLALLVGGLLLVARLVRLGFIADFMSRTVLVGFLTGVGVQVALKQIPGMFGIKSATGDAIQRLWGTVTNLDQTSMTTLAVSMSVLVLVLGGKRITRKVPWALIAVIGSIIASHSLDLSAHGVATLGKLPGGLPNFGVPDVTWSDIAPLMGTAASILVLVLAQSAATSRAYAAKYNESFDENVDLIGLAGASVAAGFSSTFVVNGSPTKTEMVDGAGGRSQLAQLTMAGVVLIVLLFLTAPIQYMPKAVLAAVVFIIGLELVDYRGMAKIYRLRLDEFVVAAITGLTVVFIGVEEGIILAIVLSIVDHLRRSYHPNNSVLEWNAAKGAVRALPVTYDARTVPGLVVYRFTASLYYANANMLLNDVTGFIEHAQNHDLRWFCIDAAAMADVDYTGAQVLDQARRSLDEHGARLVFTQMLDSVKAELDRFGLTKDLGADAFFGSVQDAIAAYAERRPS